MGTVERTYIVSHYACDICGRLANREEQEAVRLALRATYVLKEFAEPPMPSGWRIDKKRRAILCDECPTQPESS